MTVIVSRADLMRQYSNLLFKQINLHHFGFDERTLERAELIVFNEEGKVCVLQGKKWPYGKPMSGAELLQYLPKPYAWGGLFSRN